MIRIKLTLLRIKANSKMALALTPLFRKYPHSAVVYIAKRALALKSMCYETE